VSAEDTIASKPAPDPYLHTIARLTQVLREPIDPAQCVALEDSMWGLESARGAGLRTVGVAQTYGAEAMASADLVIASIAALDVDAF
jgi:beta-phosphoglucomutase